MNTNGYCFSDDPRITVDRQRVITHIYQDNVQLGYVIDDERKHNFVIARLGTDGHFVSVGVRYSESCAINTLVTACRQGDTVLSVPTVTDMPTAL